MELTLVISQNEMCYSKIIKSKKGAPYAHPRFERGSRPDPKRGGRLPAHQAEHLLPIRKRTKTASAGMLDRIGEAV